jgi:predicted CXXCH cytochrome family protein
MSNAFRAHLKHFGLAGIVLGVALLLAAMLFSQASQAAAAPSLQGEQPTDETCLGCHQQQGMSVEVGGEPLPLTIDPGQFEASVHGHEGIACVDCHTNITGFPHPEVTADSTRDFSLELYRTCEQCHGEQYESTLDSVHQREVAAGNENAAICTDCHDPHTQSRLTDENTGELLPEARVAVPLTCAQCHSTIYDAYHTSVHGAALEAGDPNVPTCTDCHGVHSIQSPQTNSFRNSVPALCANCHTNEEMMAQYDISTNVLDTYVADFHGTTVKLFEETYPDQPTNKPVCTDCHGVHDILRPDDPAAGIVYKENLLVKCQQCHPDATTASFTSSWMSHYEPTPYIFPLVFFVNLFYKIFIPLVLGGMTFYVLTDVYRRFIAKPRPAAVEGETHE